MDFKIFFLQEKIRNALIQRGKTESPAQVWGIAEYTVFLRWHPVTHRM